MDINSVWGWVLPVAMVGSIILVVIFILRYVLRRMAAAHSSTAQAALALITEVYPLPPSAEETDAGGFAVRRFALDMDVIIAVDYVAEATRVPYFITEGNEHEIGLLQKGALIEVKVNPEHNLELYICKGTLTWDGETDLDVVRNRLGLTQDAKKPRRK